MHIRLGLAAWAIALAVLSPIAALCTIAMQGSGDLWPHLFANVLPHALLQTGALIAGVGVMVVTIGTCTAYLVATCRFPGRGVFEWALLLPLAVPTYIQAYVYLDAVHPLGPGPTALRSLLGLTDPRALPLPEVRSLWGCILLLGLVLYPYVYLTVRAAFLMQAANVLEAARTLGAGRWESFFRIALPLVRPAIAVGATLALMEAINDVGASEFLGVQTLTLSIYSTWLNRSSLSGATQIGLLVLLIALILTLTEQWGRRRLKVASVGSHTHRALRQTLSGPAAALATLACLVPVGLGFLLPAGHLVATAIDRFKFKGIAPNLLQEAANSVMLAGLGTALALGCGFVVALLVRSGGSRLPARLASLGYAIPGTVLAVGLLVPLAAIDNAVSTVSRAVFDVPTGLLLSGSGVALVLAYAIRFLAIPIGTLQSGYERMSSGLDMAARSLGETHAGTVRRIHFPLLRPALGAAALLVFVDAMKELPATLMLRPLNVETLATHVYAEAVRGTYEDGAIAALLIVFVGLFPVVLLARLSRPRTDQARSVRTDAPDDIAHIVHHQ